MTTIKKSTVLALAVTCLMIAPIILRDVRAHDVALSEEPGRESGFEEGSKDDRKAGSDADHNGNAVLWKEPTDIESRDLFFGIGGREGAPDPSGKFTFMARKGAPDDTSEKIQVRDDQGRKWTVKFGPEAKPEPTVTRIVWAVGYHVDQDYFIKRTHIEGRGGFDVWDVRFERDDDGFETLGRWEWNSNPFLGTRELDGLKTLMALFNNADLTLRNTKIVRPKKKSGGDPNKQIYYVNDLGATLGSTGAFFSKLPVLDRLPADTKGVVKDYMSHRFIDSASSGEVKFYTKRRLAEKVLKGVKIENARWMGNLLGRLSDKQLTDAFRAGGFDESEIAVYVRTLRDRIKQLQELK